MFLVEATIYYAYSELGLVYDLKLRPFVQVVLSNEVQLLKDGLTGLEDFSVGIGGLAYVLFIDAERVVFVEKVG